MPDTNHPAYDAALESARLAGNNWRTGRGNIKAMVRNIVVAVKIEGFESSDLIANAKRKAEYGKMDKSDQAGWRTMTKDLNTILEGWSDLPQDVRDNFVASKQPTYSAVAKAVRDHNKAVEDAEAKEVEAERLAELGIDAETDAANKAREADANANVAAMERVVAMLNGNVERTDAENAALSRLMDAVAAMTVNVLSEAVAA